MRPKQEAVNDSLKQKQELSISFLPMAGRTLIA
jgi:hypothetical protein